MKKLKNLNNALPIVLRISSMGFGFISIILVDRLFGNAATAVFQTEVNYFVILSSIGCLGLNMALLTHSASSKIKISELQSLILAAAIASSLVSVSAISIVAAFRGSGMFHVVSVSLTLGLFAATYLKIVNRPSASVFFENLLVQVLFFTSLIIAKFLQVDATNFAGEFNEIVFYCGCILIAFSLATIAIFMRPQLGAHFSWHVLIELWRRRAFPNWLNTSLTVVLNRVELLLMVQFGLLEQAGYFTKALLIGNLCSIPLNFSASVYVNDLVQLLRKDDHAAAKILYFKFRKTVLISTIATAAFVLLVILPLSFHVISIPEHAIVCVLLICVGNVFTAWFGHFHYTLIAIGKEKECLFVNTVAVAVNIVTAIPLILYFGELGAAAAVLLTHISKSISGHRALIRAGFFNKAAAL